MSRKILSAILALLGSGAPSNAQSVPTPRKHLGFAIGTDRTLTDWHQLTSYYEKLVETSREVTVDRKLAVAKPLQRPIEAGWTRRLLDRYRSGADKLHRADIRPRGVADRREVLAIRSEAPRSIVDATDFAVQPFRAGVPNEVDGLVPRDFYIPGSILRFVLPPSSDVACGSKRESIARLGTGGRAFGVTDPTVRVASPDGDGDPSVRVGVRIRTRSR